MVKHLQTKLMLLLCMLVAGVCSVWAADYSTGTIGTLSSGDNVINGVTWNVNMSGSTYFSSETSNPARGSQFGSKNNPATSVTLSTSGITGNITKIVVESAAYSSSATIGVSVNGTSYGSNNLSSTNTSYTFEGSTAGTISIVLTNASSGGRAMYIKSIAVTYSTGSVVSYTITPQSNNEVWGTVSLDGSVITASPKDGFRVSKTNPYTVTPEGSATVAQSGNTFTVTPSADCTVTINFEAIPTHTISWSVNGNVTTTSVPEDAAITFDAPTSNIPYGYTFMGWYGSEYSSTDTAPDYVTSATCTQDATYYAVLAKGEEKSAWEKINVDEVPGEGIYAILTTDGHAFNGTISNGHGQVTETTFSFNTNNITEMAPAGTCEIEFIASSDGNGYQMYNSNYGYLYATKAASGGLAWNESDDSYWKYYKGNSETFGNWEYNKQFDGKWAYLRDYNNGSFRTYSTNSGKVILFAHKVTISSAADFRTSVVETATVGSAEWATWIAPNYVAVPTTVNAYIVEETTTSSAKLTEVLSIPAGQAVLLKTTGTHTFQVCSDEDMVDDYSGNLLKVSDETTADGVYVLAKKSNGVGFYKWAGGLLGAGRVYLDAPAAAREFLSFDEDVPTSIETLVPVVSRGNDFYDLQGRKVAQPAKGLYIVNGKKVIIK